MCRVRAVIAIAVAGWTASLSACADPGAVSPPSEVGNLREAVTPAVVSDIDRAGRFVLRRANAPEQITERQAREQAQAWLATFARFHVSRYERERGAPVDLATLTLCQETWYARSPYGEPAGRRWGSPSIRRAFGAHYLVAFCGPDGQRVLLLAVSAHNTDVSIVDGQLRLPQMQGSQFRSYGIPVQMKELPVSPERAARLAYTATGRRVAAVPQLYLPPRPLPAFEARWKVTLEAEATLTDEAGVPRRSSELWIGNASRRAGPNLAVSAGPPAAVRVTFSALRTDQKGVEGEQTLTVPAAEGGARWATVRAARFQ